MKFKTYKIIDLVVLCVLAFAIEICATYAASAYIPMMVPYPVIGMLLTLVAITRWGPIGLIVGLFSTLGNFICGAFWLPQEAVRTAYYFSWVVGLVGNMSVASALIFFKRKGKEQCFKTVGDTKNLLVAIILTNFLASFLVVFLYNIFKGTFTFDNFFKGIGQITFSSLIYNAMGYVSLIIGTLVLRNQNIFVDVKAKIIKTNKEKEAEKKYYSSINKSSDDSEEN